MKSIHFFATPSDLRLALLRMESNSPMKFVEGGTRFSSERNVFLDSREIVDLGVASHETGSLSKGYLVTLRDTQYVVRTSTTRAGASRWDLHNGDTPGSIVLTPAGVWKDMLLAGCAATVHADPIAQKLMKWFRAAIKAEQFAKAGMWWVGREALHLLDSGHRLSTTAAQSPPQFDLRPEQVNRSLA